MAVDSSIDLELQLKKRARRRLVGAIALVIIMIIVLPMALHDRSADQPRQEVTITIPSEVVNNITAKKADSVSNHVTEQLAPKPVDDDMAVSNAAQQAAIVDTDANRTNSDNKPIDKKAEAKTQADSAKVVQLGASASNTKFYVQIGVFSDADNVKKLQAKLSELGYQSQTEKISTDKGEKIRLRTSTFKERNEAAIALENIKSSGMAGIVVSQK